MRIGVPREKKPGEARVGLTPAVVAALVAHDHGVVVERDAGLAVGFNDDAYRAAGAGIVDDAATVFDVDLVVKVKELQASEYALPHRGSIVLGFQQFAVEPMYLEAARASGATFIGCETIESAKGAGPNDLPVLTAMSRIAGALAPQIGAMALMRGLLHSPSGMPLPRGAGILLGGADGTAAARVVVIGAGASGTAAARAAAAMGARVTVLAASARRFAALEASCVGHIETAVFDDHTLRALLPTTHLLIGAVLIPGRTSPCLVDRAMIAAMPTGAVFIDIGIDQRGIAETSRMSRIDDPFYV
ncbi:MAG: NAD(P)-dependent oxidoreductase, partial [Burkholderiaceae bacterium]